MKTVNKSVLIWYTPEEMFALVVDVPAYPGFLPWCSKARVVESHEDGMTAEMGISMGGLDPIWVTRNTHIPGREVAMKLVQGPFSNLDGVWNFTPIGDGSVRACRVSLQLSYEFSSAKLAAVVGPVFDKIAASLVDAFVKRAEKVYG